MSSSVPDQLDDPGSGAPVAWWNAASPGGGDVVLSGAVLLFMALAFAFVLYHYFTVSRRCQLLRDGRSVRTAVSSSSSSGGQLRARDTVSGGDAAARAAATGGVSPALLQALPLTVYSAKDHRAGGEALECAVCLADVADVEAARFLPRCGHGFHAECVDLWLRGHSTCPLCRVDVGSKADAYLTTTMPLPPALPEPANYHPTNLPTNVLFWGSRQDAVTTTARPASSSAGASSSSSAAAALVIEVRDRETAAPAVAPPPREGGAAKPLGLARLSSLRRLLWNRGRPDAAAASSSRSCRRGAAGDHGTERAPGSPLDIWNVT